MTVSILRAAAERMLGAGPPAGRRRGLRMRVRMNFRMHMHMPMPEQEPPVAPPPPPPTGPEPGAPEVIDPPLPGEDLPRTEPGLPVPVQRLA